MHRVELDNRDIRVDRHLSGGDLRERRPEGGRVKSKVAVVARREFLTTVKRPSYLIATFGMPVFVLLIVAVAAIPAILIMKKESRAKTVGVVDHSGALALTGPMSFTPPTSDEIEKVAKVVGHRQMDQYASTISSFSTLNIRPFPTLEAG